MLIQILHYKVNYDLFYTKSHGLQYIEQPKPNMKFQFVFSPFYALDSITNSLILIKLKKKNDLLFELPR